MRNHPLRLFSLILLLAVILSPATALAGNEWRPYDQAAFQKARAWISARWA